MSLQRGEQEQSLRLSPLRNRSVPVARANACHPTHRFAIEQVPGSDSSNPTASTGVDRGQTGTCKIPVFCRLARREKRLDLGGATRNTTPQAPCTELHGRYRTPKELARYAKNPGKTRVLQRRGQEPNFWVFSLCFVIVRKVLPLVLRVVMANAPTAQKRLYRRER